MKTREGVKEGEGPTFGPQLPSDTEWLLVRRRSDALHNRSGIECRAATGSTAFIACASIGWSLGELIRTPTPKKKDV